MRIGVDAGFWGVEGDDSLLLMGRHELLSCFGVEMWDRDVDFSMSWACELGSFCSVAV